jgi:hypothetical protein
LKNLAALTTLSPRRLKRLINVYRIMKSQRGKASANALVVNENNYTSVITLLTIATGASRIAPVIPVAAVYNALEITLLHHPCQLRTIRTHRATEFRITAHCNH